MIPATTKSARYSRSEKERCAELPAHLSCLESLSQLLLLILVDADLLGKSSFAERNRDRQRSRRWRGAAIDRHDLVRLDFPQPTERLFLDPGLPGDRRLGF